MKAIVALANHYPVPIHTAHQGFDQIAATLRLTSLSDAEHGHFIYGDLELAQVEFMATLSFFQWEITTAGGRDDSDVQRAPGRQPASATGMHGQCR